MVQSNKSIALPNMKTSMPLQTVPFFCMLLLTSEAKMEELIVVYFIYIYVGICHFCFFLLKLLIAILGVYFNF